MKKRIVTISVFLLAIAGVGIALANNKAKIDKAANPIKQNPVIPVKVYEAKKDSFSTSFTVNGSTIPDKEVNIASEVQGKLVALYISNGDHIRAGQVIAVLDGSVLNAQLHSIETSLDKAQLDIKRYTRLVDMGAATPMQVETAQLQYHSLMAEKKQVLDQLAHMQIRAPFNGKVENLVVEKGSFVSYGTVLAHLLDNSSLKINVYLSEQQAVKVKTGQPVAITSVVLEKPVTGSVTMVSDKADVSGKFLTEISFSNTDKNALKAGILADVYFPMEATSAGLAIPVSALVGGAKQAKVFVVKGNKVEQRAIQTGIVTENKVQVLQGLDTGEMVVISGQLNLENGTNITINQ